MIETSGDKQGRDRAGQRDDKTGDARAGDRVRGDQLDPCQDRDRTCPKPKQSVCGMLPRAQCAARAERKRGRPLST